MKNKLRPIVFRIMNTILWGTFLQMIFLSILVAADLEAQEIQSVREVEINLKLKDASLVDCFNAIENKTNYKFTYDRKILDSETKINYSSKAVAISDFLLQLSKEAKLKFRQVNNTINVQKHSKMGDSGRVLEVIIQGITITGKVTSSEDQQGLPGVNVIVKGTAQGTVTDVEGNYSLEVPGEESILVFSSVGYVQEEITVGTQTVINLAMTPDITALEEIVVIGYGTSRKRDLTGSVVSLKPSRDEALIATSFEDMLQGKAAGVNVITGGSTPGAAGSVTIRGANSLNGDSQPLYVIDNVPQSSTGQVTGSASGDFEYAQDPLAGINPNDIEDIQILKDASATAIYGSRGANGVILITTKKGSQGKVKATVGAKFTIAEEAGLIDVMNLKEYATYWNNKYPNDQRFVIGDDEIKYIYPAGEDENGDPIIAEEVIDNVDWQKEALRAAFSQEYFININAGTEKLRYNFSSSFRDVEGIIKNTGLKHGDFRLNVDSDLTNKLSLGIQLSGFLRENNMMSGGNTVGRATGAIIPSALNAQPFLRPTDDITFADNPEARATALSWISDYDDITNEYRITAAANINYQITDHLRFTLRTGGNLNNRVRKNWYGLELFKGAQNNGFLAENTLERNNYNIESLLFYNKTFGKVGINATAGVTYDVYKWLNTGLDAIDFPFHNLRTGGLHTANMVQIRNPLQQDYQLLSYLARLNASFFDGRYVLTTTIRADGTSKFSESNRWGYFPSFALAWNLNQKNFLSGSDWLSQAKLRAGYGETGSQNINPYTSIFQYGSTLGYAEPSGQQIQGLGVTGISNPDLIWETTTSVNAGFDFGFFDNRVSGAVDVYQKNTEDLLLNITIPGSTAFSTLTVNRGEIENKGIEVMANVDIIRNNNLKWTVGGNISSNRPTIKNLGIPRADIGALDSVSYFFGNTAGDHFGQPNIFIEGEAPGLFFGFKTDGIVQEGDEYPVGNPLGNSGDPGNLKVVDVNGDGVVDFNDKTIIGNFNPDYTYGFQTSLTYRQFRFRTTFVGTKGGDVFNANKRYRQLPAYQNGDGNQNPTSIANSWTPENSSNEYPSVFSNIAIGHVYDRYIEDGSFLRCNDITLGYALKNDLINKWGINSLDFTFSVRNAFTISSYSGYDPTNRSFAFDPLRRGFDLYSFPMQRSFILSMNVNF
ncbi:MAG: TonB-dependent receptor [Cytophagales bacterium]|nr:TonB-dependent receptor [Cytophagales bacterium]